MNNEEQMTDDEIRDFLESHPPTLPPFSYTFRGVPDEEIRSALVAAMTPLAEFMSRLYPLDGLDGITVATDYAEALVQLDIGLETSNVATPTEESFGAGVAMTRGVVRDGRSKSHVTFAAHIIVGLIGNDPEIAELSKHTFIHELGHVAEHSLDWSRFGDALLKPFQDKYEFELYRFSHPCWSEYYASRVSAPWGPLAMDGLRELLEGALEQLSQRIADARNAIGPLGGSRNEDAAKEIIDQVSKLMKYAGYVIGHAHGMNIEPVEPDSKHRHLLENIGLFGWFEDLSNLLSSIYDARHEWEDFSAFFPLHRAFETACFAFKLELHRSDIYSLAWRIWF